MTGILKKIISYIIYLTEPEEIILFGSFAERKNNLYSDIDLLIITDRIVNKRETESRVMDFIREFSLKSDVLIHTQTVKEKALKEPLSFLGSIIKKGTVVYKRVAF